MTIAALLLASLQTTGLREDAAAALRRAATFYNETVSRHGGYVYRYSADLAKSEGEGTTGPDTAWTQPPGTGAVGLAYLRAYGATGDRLYLDAAVRTALALVRGQLRSGGWSNSIEFGEKARQRVAYRVDPPGRKKRNWSTLDDNKTQSSLLFMIRVDRALDFGMEKIHEATLFALESLLKAQFPNGGFPQAWKEPCPYAPPAKASYPETWPRAIPRGNDYWIFPTLNDHLLRDLVPVLFEAARTYKDHRFFESARRAGDFLIGAQMDEPQPAWAQQYDLEMRPFWARKFEPPAITGSESQSAIQVLMEVARETGDAKYLEPIPRALDYLQRSRLPDGRLARFYELKTNTPLYFTKTYELTYSDADMPTHYGFKVSDRTDSLRRDLERLKKDGLHPRKPMKVSNPSDREVRRVIDALDDRGAWVEDGRLRYHRWDGRIIDSATFIRNVGVLADRLAATR